MSEEQEAHVAGGEWGEAGQGQSLWSPVEAVVKGLAFILLMMGTALTEIQKCKGHNGPHGKIHWPFVLIHVLGLLNCTSDYCLLSFETLFPRL